MDKKRMDDTNIREWIDDSECRMKAWYAIGKGEPKNAITANDKKTTGKPNTR